MKQITPELAALWVHARSEYEDIKLLEAKLEKAKRNHARLHLEIRELINKIERAAA